MPDCGTGPRPLAGEERCLVGGVGEALLLLRWFLPGEVDDRGSRRWRYSWPAASVASPSRKRTVEDLVALLCPTSWSMLSGYSVVGVRLDLGGRRCRTVRPAASVWPLSEVLVERLVVEATGVRHHARLGVGVASGSSVVAAGVIPSDGDQQTPVRAWVACRFFAVAARTGGDEGGQKGDNRYAVPAARWHPPSRAGRSWGARPEVRGHVGRTLGGRTAKTRSGARGYWGQG